MNLKKNENFQIRISKSEMEKDKREYYYDQMAYDHQFYQFIVVHRMTESAYPTVYFFWDEEFTNQYTECLKLKSITKSLNIYKSSYTTFKDHKERVQGTTYESIIGNSNSKVVP